MIHLHSLQSLEDFAFQLYQAWCFLRPYATIQEDGIKSTQMALEIVPLVPLVDHDLAMTTCPLSTFLSRPNVCHREMEVGLAMVSDTQATCGLDCPEEFVVNTGTTGDAHDQVTRWWIFQNFELPFVTAAYLYFPDSIRGLQDVKRSFQAETFGEDAEDALKSVGPCSSSSRAQLLPMLKQG